MSKKIIFGWPMGIIFFLTTMTSMATPSGPYVTRPCSVFGERIEYINFDPQINPHENGPYSDRFRVACLCLQNWTRPSELSQTQSNALRNCEHIDIKEAQAVILRKLMEEKDMPSACPSNQGGAPSIHQNIYAGPQGIQ